MTKTEFKRSLQSELQSEGLSLGNPIKHVDEVDNKTWVDFSSTIDSQTKEWLEKRFCNSEINGKTLYIGAPGIKREKVGEGYYPTGYGKGFKKNPIIYLIDGKLYAKDSQGADIVCHFVDKMTDTVAVCGQKNPKLVSNGEPQYSEVTCRKCLKYC